MEADREGPKFTRCLNARLLDATRLFAALPEEVRAGLRDAIGAPRRSSAARSCSARATQPPSCSWCSTVGSRSPPRPATAAKRWSPCSKTAACSASSPSSTTRPLGRRPGPHRLARSRSFRYEAIRDALRERPELLWVMVRLLAERLRATDEALADAVFLDVPARTAKRLLELADGQDQFTIPLTQEELASMIGASRERVNKALALFARLGWLEMEGRGHYKILDRQSLEDRATL